MSHRRTRAQRAAARVKAAAVLAGLLALTFLALAASLTAARSDSAPQRPATVTISGETTGDDNGDGHVDEDESGWDCRAMGNHRCGPAPSHAHR
jgi:hypothetical protein